MRMSSRVEAWYGGLRRYSEVTLYNEEIKMEVGRWQTGGRKAGLRPLSGYLDEYSG
jgi:hypothetical protein